MSYLLDTNVLSELRKPQGRIEPAVRSWASDRSPFELYLSAITILEIEIGIQRLRLRDIKQADRLLTWLETDVLALFGNRVLPVDVHIARSAARMHVPDPRPERDTVIAATAAIHNLTVVTRNVDDFDGSGVPTLNPWLE